MHHSQFMLYDCSPKLLGIISAPKSTQSFQNGLVSPSGVNTLQNNHLHKYLPVNIFLHKWKPHTLSANLLTNKISPGTNIHKKWMEVLRQNHEGVVNKQDSLIHFCNICLVLVARSILCPSGRHGTRVVHRKPGQSQKQRLEMPLANLLSVGDSWKASTPSSRRMNYSACVIKGKQRKILVKAKCISKSNSSLHLHTSRNNKLLQLLTLFIIMTGILDVKIKVNWMVRKKMGRDACSETNSSL